MNVRIFPYPERLSWFADHGMPQSRLIASVPYAKPIEPDSARWRLVNFDDPRFKPLKNWALSSATVTYAEFLIVHPLYDLTAPFQMPRLSEFGPAGGDILGYDIYPIPHWQTGLAQAFFPSWEVVVVYLAIGSLLLARRRLLKERSTLLVLIVCGWGMLIMMFAWHAEGLEVVRHMLMGNVSVRLGIWILLLSGLFGSIPMPTQSLSTNEPFSPVIAE